MILPYLLIALVPVDLPQAPEGFVVEHVHHASGNEGSWVCMDFDDAGRMVIAPERGPLLRLSLSGTDVQVEELDTPVQRAQGLLHVGDSLYCNVNAPLAEGGGLHRLRDADGDGAFESHRQLSKWDWGGEHGGHAVRMGPDGLLYILQGNHVRPPDSIAPTSPLQNWDEDILVERLWDPRGHAVGRMSPAGHVLRTDLDGTRWELVAGGLRNAYDMDFNEHGELFAYDADMEWDLGTAWYRLPRVVHLVSGGETGWRGGSAKWSDAWPDATPAVAETGVGSPTGVCFAYGSSFPEPWRSSLLLGDWSYGRILACRMDEHGAGYTGTIEPFITGKPFNVTDMDIGPDGNLYCITGGRGTASDLYRVRWIGAAAGSPERIDSGADARTRRRTLEALHDEAHPGRIELIWESLGDDDRAIRFASRVALERIDPDAWDDLALSERDPATARTALLALARVGSNHQRSIVLDTVARRLPTSSGSARIDLLRTAMIAMARGGTSEHIGQAVADGYPDLDGDFEHDRLGSIMLAHLQHESFIDTTLDLLEGESDPSRQLQFALVLRLAADSFDDGQRSRFRNWHENAWHFEGGLSVRGFVDAIGEPVLGPREQDDAEAPVMEADILHEWTMADVAPYLPLLDADRNLERGRLLLESTLCLRCHRFGNEGGATGPDLSAAGSRFSRSDLLETILQPSRVVSDQYLQQRVHTVDGAAHVGRVTRSGDDLVISGPYGIQQTRVAMVDVDRLEPVESSSMPPGLVNTLTREQLLDLLACLEAGAELPRRSEHPAGD